MPTATVKQFAIVRGPDGFAAQPDGGLERADSLKEAASQSFKAGQAVALASGLVAAAAAAEKNPHTLLGQAQKDATGVTNAPVNLVKIKPGTVIEANLYHSTPASSVYADALHGTAHYLYVDAAGMLRVDIVTTVTTAYPQVSIMGPVDAAGTVHGRVLAEVLDIALDRG